MRLRISVIVPPISFAAGIAAFFVSKLATIIAISALVYLLLESSSARSPNARKCFARV